MKDLDVLCGPCGGRDTTALGCAVEGSRRSVQITDPAAMVCGLFVYCQVSARLLMKVSVKIFCTGIAKMKERKRC